MSAASPPVRVGLDLGRRVTTILVRPSQGGLLVEQLVAPPDRPTPTLAERCRAAWAAVQRLIGAEPQALELSYTASATTHALLHAQLPRIALLVSEGFTDVLRVGSQAAPKAPSRSAGVSAELLAAVTAVPVGERLAADGTVVTELTDEALAVLREQLRALPMQAQAVAVTLLHSYKDARHEQRVAQALAELGLPVLLSSDVLPAVGEFTRASATVLAAIQAVAQTEELLALRAALPATAIRRGVLSDGTARVQPPPLRALLGDVAAGLIGIERAADALAVPRFISLGVGETTSAAAVHEGTLALTTEGQLAGLPLVVPTLAAVLRPVGAEALLGAAAADAYPPSASLGLHLAAAGIDQLVDAVWAAAVPQGQDPAEYPLLCHGPVAGLVAALVADRLGMQQAIVPPAAGLLSAYGALSAPVFRERAQTLRCEASRAQQLGTVEAALRALAEGLRQDLLAEGQTEAGTGSQPLGAGARWQWFAELRYEGQSHSLTLPGLGEGGPAPDGTTDLVVRFHQEHERRYGYTIAERPVQLERVRLRASLPIAAPAFAELIQAARTAAAASPAELPSGVRVLRELPPASTATDIGRSISGPALLDLDRDGKGAGCGLTLVPAGWCAEPGPEGAIRLSLSSSSSPSPSGTARASELAAGAPAK